MRHVLPIRARLLGLGLIMTLAMTVPASAVVVPMEPVPAARPIAKFIAAIAQYGCAADLAPWEVKFFAVKLNPDKTDLAQLRLRLRQGYDIMPLGELQMGDQRVTLWKIEFADKGDDLVVALGPSDDRVPVKT